MRRFLDWLRQKSADRQERQKRERAMEKHGWDGKCPHCQTWLHTHEESKCVEATVDHWEYECGNCHGRSRWLLYFMLPVFDEDFHNERYGKRPPQLARDTT